MMCQIKHLLTSKDQQAEKQQRNSMKTHLLKTKKSLFLSKINFVLKAQKEEKRIMPFDTTNMPAFKAQYCESLQKEILAKRVNNSSK